MPNVAAHYREEVGLLARQAAELRAARAGLEEEGELEDVRELTTSIAALELARAGLEDQLAHARSRWGGAA